jgi:hypothetical protein
MTKLQTTLLLGAGASLTTALGFLIGTPWLLPILGGVVPFALFLPRIRRERYGAAVAWVLVWAIWQSLAVGVAVTVFPERAAEVVLRGPAYAEEMIHWVRTGEGPEGSPRLYLPIHLRHYLLFCVLSLLSLGGLGLALGAALLNYMNYYVAELVRVSAEPSTAALFGWPIWAVIRVVGFVVTGAAMAGLGWQSYLRVRGRSDSIRFPARIFAIGLALVAVDAILKAILAPFWRNILLPALGN